MKGTLAVFDRIGATGVAGLFRDGVLDDLLLDAPGDAIRPGAIFRARVQRPMKGQGGVFLDTPQGNVFLRQAGGLRQGQSLFVQATTHAQEGKATPVSDRVVFKSRYCLVTPGAPGLNLSRDIRDEERRVALRALLDGRCEEGIGLVVRSAAGAADDAAVLADAEAMLALAGRVMAEPRDGAPELLLDGPDARDLAWREWPEPDAVEDRPGAAEATGLLEAIAEARRPRVALGEAATMFVEPTRALVAVDVNTGGDTSPAAGLKANLAAARALPRALRVRGLGGQVVIDLAPMPKKDRKPFEQAVRAAFRRDPIETSLVGWTPLGHLELSRKRERLPLVEVLG